MRIDVDSIDGLHAAAAELGHDLRPVDAAIRAAVPDLRRWLYTGASITMIGYGEIPPGYTTGDQIWPLIGLAPQKRQISVYVAGAVMGEGIAQHYQGRMGRTNNGVGCIRFARFSDLDEEVFAQAMRDTAEWAIRNPSR